MYYCVAYDISSNRLRLRVVKMLKRAGLVRLQKSVFTGEAQSWRMTVLESTVKAMLQPKDKFCIAPLDRLAWQNLVLLGDNADKTILSRAQPLKYY